jgi:catechol 2,3-dioxygenase-like lactoylglutathione lyase family enzyme
MDAGTYQRFTAELIAWAEANPDVIGLVALGSMAGVAHSPDEWSDHDFWVIATAEAAPAIRDDPSWLPEPERIVLFFAETEHGRNAVYDDGHLIEQAVFADHELEITTANAYRVLVDKADIAARMERIAAATATGAAAAVADAEVTWGRFVGRLVIGVSRYGRGEDLSAGSLVRGWAPSNLLALIRDHVEGAPGAGLDTLDPYRRFERGFPATAARLEAAIRRPLPEAASVMLDVAEELLADRVAGHDAAAIGAVRRLIARAAAARPEAASLHHVQLAMPTGGEVRARAFYEGALGMTEVEKPPVLAERGGCCFRLSDLEIHLGVEDPFAPARKAHPAILIHDVDGLARRVEESGHDVRWDPHVTGHRRFSTDDPFGNRLDFLRSTG